MAAAEAVFPLGLRRQERKVRAPQDRVVDNIDRPQGSGKCNREQTAAATVEPPSGPSKRNACSTWRRGKGETVR